MQWRKARNSTQFDRLQGKTTPGYKLETNRRLHVVFAMLRKVASGALPAETGTKQERGDQWQVPHIGSTHSRIQEPEQVLSSPNKLPGQHLTREKLWLLV